MVKYSSTNTATSACSRAMEFSSFWSSSHSVLPCLQKGVKNATLQTTSNDLKFRLLPFEHSPPPPYPHSPHSPLHFFCVCGGGVSMCVRACVRACVRVCVCVCANNATLWFEVYVNISVDLVKRGVLTLVDETRRYQKKKSFFFLYLLLNSGCGIGHDRVNVCIHLIGLYQNSDCNRS